MWGEKINNYNNGLRDNDLLLTLLFGNECCLTAGTGLLGPAPPLVEAVR